MKAKSILCTLILIFVGLGLQTVQAQKRKEVRDIIMSGNEYFFTEQYSKAIEFYYRALSLDSTNVYANYYIAECHRNIFNFQEAEYYYGRVAADPKTDFPLSKFYFPLMQKFNGKFDQAIDNFDHFIDYARGKSFNEKATFMAKAEIEKKGCLLAISQLENPFGEYNFENVGLPVNSQYNDYAPFILDHDSLIVVTSGRSSVKGKLLDNRYGEYFSDNFRFYKASSKWVMVENEDGFDINNTELGEGAGSYAHIEEAFYFTGCYEADFYCKIYKSEKIDGIWQAPTELPSPINLKDTDNKQPFASPNGDTLFFVSNRPAGFGGNDIWMSIKDKEGKWIEPINMGPKVNTPYNEVSPFYYSTDDILFFASDGHEGLGGLDIFMAKGGIGTFSQIENVGYPFNSNQDDGYMVLGKDKGFLTSNRQGGVGNFDVYRFNIITRQSIIADINKTEMKEEKEKILQSRVMSRSGTEVYMIREDDQFFYENLAPEEQATVARIVAAKLQVFSKAQTFQLSEADQQFYNQLAPVNKIRIDKIMLALYEEGKDDLEQYIQAIPERQPWFTYLTITGKLFATETGLPASQIEIPLVDEEGQKVKTTTTNEDGTFKYINLPTNRKYRILSGDGPKKLTESPKFYVKDVQLEERVRKPVPVYFESVYFDMGQKQLRPEAKLILNDLVTFYDSNPQIQIALFAYTDTIGSDAFNLQLSADRGKTVLNYLIDKGVDRTALIVEAQGKDNTPLSENEQINMQLKRRVDFNIVGATQQYLTTVKTYMTRKQISLKQLAESTGNTIEELRHLNGIVGNSVPAYTPVRIEIKTAQPTEDILFGASMR